MARIIPMDLESASQPAREAWEAHERDQGRMTHMKRTLLHSLPSFRALMEWYPLRDTIRPFLGDRATTIFAHAISAETDCLICSTFFRRILIDTGENPDELKLDEQESLLVQFGRQLARDPKDVSDVLYTRLAHRYAPEQIVALTAFACIMLATNWFNDALRVELDGYLEPYRLVAGKPPDSAVSHQP